MYRCKWCGSVFCEPKIVYERHGLDWGAEEREVCPFCNEDRFESVCEESGEEE
jgi:hypothetical protein